MVSQKGLVNSVSRSGDPRELLRGPLFYVYVLVAVTVLCWRSSAAGFMVIAMMCGGDGLADVVGRRFGTSKLPWNSNKSWAGSLGMFLGGAALGLACVLIHGIVCASTHAWLRCQCTVTKRESISGPGWKHQSGVKVLEVGKYAGCRLDSMHSVRRVLSAALRHKAAIDSRTCNALQIDVLLFLLRLQYVQSSDLCVFGFGHLWCLHPRGVFAHQLDGGR